MFWGGLQMALSNSPMNSDIICFTDAVGKDGEKMPSVKALAEDRMARISIISSLFIHSSKEQVTTVQDYLDICIATGGLCIPSNKVDTDEIVGILSKSVETAKATIALYSNLTGDVFLIFPIDNFWESGLEKARVEVKIAGGVSLAVLTSNSTIETVNLLDDESVSASSLDIEMIVRQDGLLYFSFRPDVVGDWN